MKELYELTNKIDMNTIYTSIEQSKKLLQLGMSPESADLCYHCYYVGDENGDHPYYKLGEREEKCREKDCIPCWSVGALKEVITGSFSLFHDGTYWWCEWSNTDSDYIDFTTTCKCNTAIEAVYKTVVWLLENVDILPRLKPVGFLTPSLAGICRTPFGRGLVGLTSTC